MKHIAIIGTGLFMLACSFSPVELKSQDIQRKVTGFNSISYTLPGKLTIIPGSSEGLVIKGSKETTERIITEVKDNELKIYTKSVNFRDNDFEIIVNVINLNELSIAGSGDVDIKDVLKSDHFELDMSGSSDVNFNRLEGSHLEIEIAGSGNVEIAGKVDKIEIDVAGSGGVSAGNLESENADVDIAGSGNVTVWVNQWLDSDIAGSGNVYYKGKPLVDAETVGSGHTKPL